MNTTTDYLLGLTDVPQNDVNIRMIGDYLGLSDESIKVLHSLYSQFKDQVTENELLKEVEFFSGATPSDPNFESDYAYVSKEKFLDLQEYTKTINSFLCSSEFIVFIRCLDNNLFIERYVYDLLRIVNKQYDDIETPFPSRNYAEIAYGLVELGEDLLKRYALNSFDALSALTEFCNNFTKLEKIKKLDYTQSFYKKIIFYVYHYTRPMFESGEYSVRTLEDGLEEYLINELALVKNLLREKSK